MKSGMTLFIFRVIFFILLFYTNNIFAQNNVSDNASYHQALADTRAVYYQSFGEQSALYNGQQYGDYLFGFENGQPFFYSAEPVVGSIIYDGVIYDSILMRYDEIKDVVAVNHLNDKIQLWNEKVQGFNLYNSTFILLLKDSLSSSLVNSGFYNLLYKGKVSLFKKEIKTLMERTTLTELLRIIQQKDHYYIKKEGKFYPIKSKKDLFEIFGDSKKQIQRFININGLNFRKDPQNMLVKTTAYYDGLKK